jgi:hypothetical protein
VSAEVAKSLRELSRREGATLFMTVLAVFNLLLQRYSRQEDIVVGTPISGRNREELEGLIGCFLNTLVLRTDLSGNPSFRELLGRVREAALEAYAHQDLPFEKLVEELQPERDLSRTPLFQVLLVVQQAGQQEWKLPGLNLSVEPVQGGGTAKFDLTLFLTDTGERLEAAIEYSTELFEEWFVQRMPETRQALTGSRGYHYWFRLPGGVQLGCFNGFEYGLDVRADGGYVVVEPSVHRTGNIYRWDGLAGFDEPVAEIPLWLLNLLISRRDKNGAGEPWRQIDIAVNRQPELSQVLLDCIENDSVLSGLWNLRRTDFANPKTGQPNFSSYDLALASHFAKAGSSHQQVADIVTAFRLKHGNPKGKGHRLDYLQRTVYKAFQHDNGSTVQGGPETQTEQSPEGHAMAAERACACLYGLLAEAQDSGKAGPLFDASIPLATISNGEFSDFIGAIKKSVAESKIGLHVDLNLLKKSRRIAVQTLRHASASQQSMLSPERTGKPAIMVSNRQLSELRVEAVVRLQESNEPPVIFQRLRELVRFRVDAMNEPFLETFDENSLRGRLADVASFYEERKNGDQFSAFPPRALCEDILAYDHAPNTFPVVEAISRSPIVRPDGSIFSSPGYDPTTHVILCPPPGFALPPIPLTPTKEEVEAAKRLLLDLVGDFLFEGSADKTNFLGFCITTLIRQQVDVVPMCVFDSPTPGAGKGLLTDLASIIATGEVAAVIPPPATREEWPKLLASLLDNGRTFITFDNLHDALKSDALEAVLTKPFLQFRQLGHTRERIVPNRAVWCVTGNNVAVSPDMVRRCYRVRIDPLCAQPHLRKNFKHPNLVAHCKTERANLLAALLVLIRAWHAAGKPAFGGTQLGTYTAWKDTVGGILKNAGFEDFLGNQRKLYAEMDQESGEWETFWLQLHDRFGENDFTIKQIIPLIHHDDLVLPREVAKIYGQTTSHVGSKPNPYFAAQLGSVLRSHRGTRYGASEVYLERDGEDRHAKTACYRIRRGDRK